MITFLLCLLKITGLIVLILLAVLLALILAILFVPVRYHADGRYHSDFQCMVKISWLLHIISVRFIAENELQNIIFHIFGIPVWNKNKAEKRKQQKDVLYNKKQKSGKKEKKHKKKVKQKSDETVTGETVSDETVTDETVTDETVADKTVADKTVTCRPSKDDSKEEKVLDDGKKKSKIAIFVNKMIEIFHKLIEALKNVKSTFFNICDKIKDIMNHIAYYKQLYQDERTQRALKIVKKWLKKLFGNCKPGKLKACIHFGFEDPSKVADILRYYSMAYPFVGQNIIVYPDFENKVFEADFLIKGRVTLFWFAYAVWQYLFQKDIRFVKKHIFREEK